MKAALVEEGADQGVGLDSTGYYDQEIYGGSDSRFAGYVTSIAANEQEDVSVACQILCFDVCILVCFLFYFENGQIKVFYVVCNTDILLLFLGVRRHIFNGVDYSIMSCLRAGRVCLKWLGLTRLFSLLFSG